MIATGVGYWGVLLNNPASDCVTFVDVQTQVGNYVGVPSGPNWTYGPFDVDFTLTDVQAGDLFVAKVKLGQSAPAGWAVGHTDGFTQLFSWTTYYLFADGTETDVTFTAGNGTTPLGSDHVLYDHALVHYRLGEQDTLDGVLVDAFSFFVKSTSNPLDSSDLEFFSARPVSYIGLTNWLGETATPTLVASDLNERAQELQHMAISGSLDYQGMEVWDTDPTHDGGSFSIEVTGSTSMSLQSVFIAVWCPPDMAVTGLTATTGAGDGEVDLSWDDNIPDAVFYDIYLDGLAVDTISAASTTYTYTGPSPGIVYGPFTVRASASPFDTRHSAPSNQASALAGGVGPIYYPCSDPAPNDDFADRVILTGSSGIADPVCITNATTEVDEPIGSDLSNLAQTVWFEWTAPADGTVTFDTFRSLPGNAFSSDGLDPPPGSDATGHLDTTLAAWTGTMLTDLVEAASNDDEGGNPYYGYSSVITFAVTNGTTYYIQVGAFDEGYNGQAILEWELV